MEVLAEKVAMVTGAGRGIGRAVAEVLAREGATVVLVSRTRAQLDDVAATIRRAGGSALVAPGDITDQAFVERLFDGVRRDPGRLDILVNNAGVAPFGPVEALSPAVLRECLEINVIAAYACMQQAIRLMNEAGGAGKVVNIGSVRSHWTEAGGAGAYNASKYAIRALTESVARQLHGSGSCIAVSLVCPGVVDTTLTNPGGEPRPGWLRPENVAQAVLHAVTAPAGVNVFDTTLFPMEQRPW